MKPRVLNDFLGLYTNQTRRSLRWVLVGSVLLALLDFVSLLLLLPVFGVLASNGGAGSSSYGVAGGFLEGIGAGSLVVLAMTTMILRSIGGFLVRFWWSRRVAEAEVGLSSRLLSAYAYAPYEFHLRRNSADLLARAVAHVNSATGSGLNGIVLVVTDATTVAALAAALFVASPLAGGAVLIYVALIGYGFVHLSRRFTANQAKRYSHEVAQVYLRASTVLRGIRELTVADGRATALKSVETSRTNMARAQRNMLVLTDVPRLTLETALYGAILAALFLVLSSSHPSDSLPVVALYVIAGLRILPAITRCLGNLTQFRSGREIGRQVSLELTYAESVALESTRASGQLPRIGTLALADLSFSYSADVQVLRNIDLDIPYGTFLALVGESGSGKSTLLGMMLGLLNPTTGTVSYGGASVGLADPEWLRHVGYVPQEAFILDDNLRNNVSLGDVAPDEKRVWDALDRAALGHLVRSMPAGLETPLGEGGSRLSVGQRQRLGIARALYRQPAVLILDEPTAALDQQTEAQVIETIDGLKGSLTIILVAHRMETIAGADITVRLDKGLLEVVAASGNHHAMAPSATNT